MPSFPVFLALGANLGAREATLEAALAALARQGVQVRRRSGLYLTEPVGGPPQDWYVNQVVLGETALEPAALLETALAIERAHGRERSVPNAPRTLDIDILFFGERVVTTPRLTIPHPRLQERRFVLVPLAEIAPEHRHPVSGLTARELLARCADTARVVPHGAPIGGAVPR